MPSSPSKITRNTLLPLSIITGIVGGSIWLTSLFNATHSKLDLLIEDHEASWSIFDQRLFVLELKLLNPDMKVPEIKEDP